MTRDTNSYRSKGRAVFLAAIMVLSVVAVSVSFTGAAAAAITNTSTDGPAEAEAGQTINVDVTVNADSADVSALQIAPDDRPDHNNDFANGGVIDSGAETQLETFGLVAYSNLQNSVTTTYQVTIPEDVTVGDTLTLTGDALNESQERTEFSYSVNVVEDADKDNISTNESDGTGDDMQPNESDGTGDDMQPNESDGTGDDMQPNESDGTGDDMQPNESDGEINDSEPESESADQRDDEEKTETTVPGFGFITTLLGLFGGGYMLIRRLSSSRVLATND